MVKTVWKSPWYPGRRAVQTSEAAETLIDNDGGQVESAKYTAENAVNALGRLVETLHEKGLLTTDEVQQVLDLYGYEVAEDEE